METTGSFWRHILTFAKCGLVQAHLLYVEQLKVQHF